MSRRLSGGVGYISKPSGSSAFDVAEVSIRPFRAGGAIPQGSVVMIAFDATRPEVVVAGSGDAFIARIVGVYDPEWNDYKDAVEGDIVHITSYGMASALCNGGTNDILVNDVLETTTNGVLLQAAPALSNDVPAWQFIAAEAFADAGPALKRVFVRCG